MIGIAVTPECNIVDLGKIEIGGGDVVGLGFGTNLEVDVEVFDKVIKVCLIDGQVLDIDTEDVERLVGDTSKSTNEEEDDGADCKDEWQRHTEEATDTHCDDVMCIR